MVVQRRFCCMKKSSFEEMGGTYTLVGDYYLPDLVLPAEEDDRPLGIWAQRRWNYIKAHRRALFARLVMTNKVHSHLADAEEQAESLLLRLVDEMASSDGITERLKAEDQMEWVRRMNCIKEQAMEIVMNEVIYQ